MNLGVDSDRITLYSDGTELISQRPGRTGFEAFYLSGVLFLVLIVDLLGIMGIVLAAKCAITEKYALCFLMMVVLLLASVPVVTVATALRPLMGGTFERLANNLAPAPPCWLQPLTSQIGALGVRGPLGGVSFREAPYVAYYLDLDYGGRAGATYPPDVLREAQAAGLGSVLVFAGDDATRYYWKQLGNIEGVRRLGEVPYAGAPNASIIVYGLAPWVSAPTPTPALRDASSP